MAGRIAEIGEHTIVKYYKVFSRVFPKFNCSRCYVKYERISRYICVNDIENQRYE